MKTNIDAAIRHKANVALKIASRFGGFAKVGVMPLGGSPAGPSRSASKSTFTIADV